jgi:dimethylamine/trimethylamine dehydrogenase
MDDVGAAERPNIFDGHRLAQGFESPDPQRPKAIIRERRIWGQTVYPKLG